MNKRNLLLALFTGIAALGAALMLPSGHASALTVDPLNDYQEAAKLLLASLVGIPALVAGLLALLEYLNVVTPAVSDKLTMYLNTVLYLVCFFAVVLGKTDIVILIDRYAGGIAPILAALLALLAGGIYSTITTKRMLTAARELDSKSDTYGYVQSRRMDNYPGVLL